MLRLARVVAVMVGVIAAAAGLAMAAGHVGLTSDDGLRIVFAALRPDNSRAIYWVNPTNGVIRLIVEDAMPQQPACSRLDNRIVFTDFAAMNSQMISIISANGKNRQDVVMTEVGVSDFQWSPDGQRISYTEWLLGRSDIKLLRLSGSFPVTTIDTAPIEGSANWSPDGHYLILDSSPYDSTTELNHYAVALYDLQTTQTTEIFVDQLGLHSAIWSPDNQNIAYVSYLDGVYSIHLYDVQSGTASKLVDGAFPNWSPDGSRLAFNQYLQGTPTIAILDMESRDVETLVRGLSPIWSPDGQQIAFFSGTFSETNISVMNADGSHAREVTSFPGTETFPCWLYLQNFPEGN